jgi:sortase A
MQRNQLNSAGDLARVEHAVAMLSSLVWTAIILLGLVFLWGFQDARAQWEVIERGSPSASVAQLSPSDNPDAPRSATWLVDDPSFDPAGPGASGDPPSQVLPETPLEGLPAGTPTPTPRPPAPIPAPSGSPTRLPSAAPAVLLPAPTATQPSTPTSLPPVPTSTSAPATAPVLPADYRGPTRLVIASLGIDTPVVPVMWATVKEGSQIYSMWQVANYAAGWHATSAEAGQPGNTVVSGHHNIKGEVFRYLSDVQEGAEVDLYVGDTLYRYYVEQKMIVKEKGEPLEVRQQNARWIGPSDDVRLTLITCWPYTNNTHRVIVVARPHP